MLFNEAIESLHDDGFEGSMNESNTFKEVFFGNDSDTSSKRGIVTGAINFDHSNCTDRSLWTNTGNSSVTSLLDSGNVGDDSRDSSLQRCFSIGKRMKFSVDELSCSTPYSRGVLDSSAPSKELVSGRYQAASSSVCDTVTCRLVESSSQGVTSSFYLLKRHAVTNPGGEIGDRDVSESRMQSVGGSYENEVNVSKAIVLQVPQESSAAELLVTCPSVTVANKSPSHGCAEGKRMKKSNFNELLVVKTSLDIDSAKDPRPLLRPHVQNLLRAAGWEIGRRKRSDNIRGEYLYFPPRGRPIREFRRVWKLCGQSLFPDRIIDLQEDGTQWTDMAHFCDDLSSTFVKIEEELDKIETETTSALAHLWCLLDPFAIMVFIEKKLGTLRAGKPVKTKRSLVRDTFANDDARERATRGFEGIYRVRGKKCGTGSSAYFRQLQRKAVKASKVESTYLSKEKCTNSTSTIGTQCMSFSQSERGRNDLISSQAYGSDATGDLSNSCLFEVPIIYGSVNIMHRGSDLVSPHYDVNSSFPSCDRQRSAHSEEMALEVKVEESMGSFQGNALAQHFQSQNLSRVMQHSGHIKREKCIEGSRYRMNGAIRKKKATNKPKRTSESKQIALFPYDRLGPSTSNRTEPFDTSTNNIWSESVGHKEYFIATNGRIDTSYRKSFNCSSQYWNGKKPSQFRKVPGGNSGRRKKANHFFYKEFKFENITNETPLHMENESLQPEAWRQEVKTETQNESGKRSIRCRLKDDDLLISAVIKNKTFGSTTKQHSQKMKSHESEALRKRKSQKGSCRLLPRSLGKGGKHIDGTWSPAGVRTVLSWLIDSGVISLNEAIQYRSLRDDSVVKDGLVTRDGIICKCCNQVLSVSEFKIHAGFRLKRPCLNLVMESGKPFTLCQLEAWSAEYKARKSATRTVQVYAASDQNDDRCGLCGDGGELICCDDCPSTFHQECLYAQELPEGSWYCPYCACRICGNDGAYDKEPLKSPGNLKCSQCGHKYHEACLKEKGTCGEVASDPWFCSESCQEVYLGLHERIGIVDVLSDGFSCTLLRCIHGDPRVHSAQRFVALKAECNSKLAVALTIMEECFLSIVDPRTGIDMIPHVVYNWGSQYPRLNYSGFYTLLLEKDDVLMSVASVRIHGVEVAEMPLIATCNKYRRQGMCRRLMNSIEEMLRTLKVEKLVISALPSLVETWTARFGFEPMEDKERNSLIDINLMVFPGTVWLKKPIYRNQETDQQGHASPSIKQEPNETAVCPEGEPAVESWKQSDGSSSTEIRLSDCINEQVEHEHEGVLQSHFLNLSYEEPASTVEGHRHEMVCNIESVVLSDERILSSIELSEKAHMLQDSAH
ncbi:hypothetical protein Vadar_011022 [Vaccinium darrowii]|uniref:Uncharacterized protein n=1 Tax=Vaccinium darrowii TaxID=229202 RepID=A0ACB7XPV0_9ERIC|nr:hypothetical protein Vadar_011022 [Vaccinium darrowii]